MYNEAPSRYSCVYTSNQKHLEMHCMFVLVNISATIVSHIAFICKADI